MGVVRERKVVCESGTNPPSNPESAQNSGYTTQESEDEELQEPQRLRRQPLRTLRGLNLNFNHNITRHSGKRRVRRVLNSKFLETLIEEAEDDSLMDNSKSKFQILMENTEDAIEFLNNFEMQTENADEFFDNSSDESNNIACLFSNPYLNIPRKIRAAIGSRKNFQYDLLKSIEVKLVCDTLHTEFFYYPDTCYERMLVHAVAKYNGFISETVTTDEKRAVRIACIEKTFTPRVQLLCDYIEEMRRKNINEEVNL